MSMEISEISNSARLYQNPSINGKTEAEKTTESKETDTQRVKTEEPTAIKRPRYDTVEISNAGKERMAGANEELGMKLYKATDRTVQKNETQKQENISKEIPQSEVNKPEKAAGGEPAEETTGKEAASKAASVESANKPATAASKKEEEDPTDDLSSLTDTELKQLYLEWDITRVEYDDELADRGIVEE